MPPLAEALPGRAPRGVAPRCLWARRGRRGGGQRPAARTRAASEPAQTAQRRGAKACPPHRPAARGRAAPPGGASSRTLYGGWCAQAPEKAQAAIQACARHTRSLSSPWLGAPRPQRRTHTQTRLSFVRTHTPATHTPRQLRAAREHGAGTPACRRACAARARQLPPNTHALARAPAAGRRARCTPPPPPTSHTPGAKRGSEAPRTPG